MLVSVGLCEITAAVEQELLAPYLCDTKALEENPKKWDRLLPW